jgi:hypothetical protein
MVIETLDVRFFNTAYRKAWIAHHNIIPTSIVLAVSTEIEGGGGHSHVSGSRRWGS